MVKYMYMRMLRTHVALLPRGLLQWYLSECDSRRDPRLTVCMNPMGLLFPPDFSAPETSSSIACGKQPQQAKIVEYLLPCYTEAICFSTASSFIVAQFSTFTVILCAFATFVNCV